MVETSEVRRAALFSLFSPSAGSPSSEILRLQLFSSSGMLPYLQMLLLHGLLHVEGAGACCCYCLRVVGACMAAAWVA